MIILCHILDLIFFSFAADLIWTFLCVLLQIWFLLILSNAKSEVRFLIDIVDIENKYGVVQSSTKVFAKYCHALVFVKYFLVIMKLS